MNSQIYKKPNGLIGRFAVVKLWPELKTAEDECVARLKSAAELLGLECIEILFDGTFVSDENKKISRDDVDFVIHLHYDTPKNYDAFSFAALWNPIKFYFEWGYERCSRNLTTHDDFLSCSSDVADDHVNRMIRLSQSHLPPKFKLYHSTPDVMYEPTLGELKLFYAGINWEAVSGGKSRHQEVLKKLDKTGHLRIYGPEIFQGVKVWAGYKSYIKEIPFDGISMIDEISKAGIALVLSSQAHKESGLMSSRLFESIAAGAVIICDENPFAKKHFGDSLLYIDSRSDVDELLSDIQAHISWVQNNRESALAMAKKAQSIFKQGFTLIENIKTIYDGLEERKKEINALNFSNKSSELTVRLFCLMPEFSEDILNSHVSSVSGQDYLYISPALVVDRSITDEQRMKIDSVVSRSSVNIEIIYADFQVNALRNKYATEWNLGGIMHELISTCLSHDSFVFVAPNEQLLSNHISTLVSALVRDDYIDCAASAAVLGTEGVIHSIHERIDFRHVDKNYPNGFGRYIFRSKSLQTDLNIALPYLHSRALAVLVGDKKISQLLPATIKIDISNQFPMQEIVKPEVESEIILAYCPEAFDFYSGFGKKSTHMMFHQPTPIWTRSKLIASMFNYRWVKAQIVAVRKHGFQARFKTLKSKLGL